MGKRSRHPVGDLVAIALIAVLGVLGACSDGSPAPAQDGGADAAGDAGGGPAELCAQTGGTVGTQLCCGSVTDFPDTCGVGNCGCSPSASHEVQVCTCTGGRCFSADKGCRAP